MKRILAFFCTLTMILPLFAFTASAASEDGDSEDSVSLTVQEQSVLQEKLIAYGYGDEEFTADLLYDADDCPTFLLGTTKEGYIVLRRESNQFCECGEGNPYRDYMTNKKYYAGAVCYFVQLAEEGSVQSSSLGGYYDILRGTYSSLVPRLDTSRVSAEQQEDYEHAESPTSIDYTVTLSQNYDYIRRKAFGNNTDNTCSAVATGIALNYIAARHNMAIIATNHISEKLDKGLPNSKKPISGLYPNANRLHRYLVDTCRMEPVSYAEAILGAVRLYTTKVVPLNNIYQFSLQWTLFPKASTIKKNIQADKPVLITTTLFAQYDFHTMCVYGYRDTSDGPQLLVHTGWYSRPELESLYGSSTNYYQTEIWINESDATYGYYFSFHNPLASFNDIPIFTHWAYPGILYVVNRGLMNGTTSTTFAPGHTMSRAMLVSTLYRMAGSPSVTYTNTFSDVPKSAWYANSVIWASKHNIVSGVGGGRFNPDGNVTREQAATFLFRYAAYRGYNTSRRANLSAFPDRGSVSSFAKEAMPWAVAENVINGTVINDVTVLAPQNNANRGQAASFLMRFEENVAK